ncbi:MAG: glucosaminidase domain-containing protein [Prevotellaceae bacterium]|nr:glucosaminidase domain-containing protein [Prevotellaceae bacterium]
MNYIAKYKEFAILQQSLYGVPASITMAQALVESQAGESRLAVKGNNHFGIKCGSNWSGKTITKDDDNVADCFRKYPKIEDSYTDHSVFLKRTRYEFLFDYDVQDYKSWAVGLKKAGYATDKSYDAKLIKIIEDYNLNSLVYADATADLSAKNVDFAQKYNGRNTKTEVQKLLSEERNNFQNCYKLKKDATMEEVAAALRKNFQKMLYYNDLFEDRTLPAGTYIYTGKKYDRATSNSRRHVVQEGESMHLIAQLYGITLKSLYKINGITYGARAVEGQTLNLH